MTRKKLHELTANERGAEWRERHRNDVGWWVWFKSILERLKIEREWENGRFEKEEWENGDKRENERMEKRERIQWNILESSRPGAGKIYMLALFPHSSYVLLKESISEAIFQVTLPQLSYVLTTILTLKVLLYPRSRSEEDGQDSSYWY